MLAPLAPSDPDARAALRAMGELAIPVLADHAGNGNVWAVGDLTVVGTPAAAESLAPMLWSTEEVATNLCNFHVRVAYDEASRSDTPSSSATRLAVELLDWRCPDPRYRQLIKLLTWPVRAKVLGNLVATGSPATQKHWIEVMETPRSSKALWAFFALAIAVSLLGTSGIVIYRSVMTITGSWLLGSEWLHGSHWPASCR